MSAEPDGDILVTEETGQEEPEVTNGEEIAADEPSDLPQEDLGVEESVVETGNGEEINEESEIVNQTALEETEAEEAVKEVEDSMENNNLEEDVAEHQEEALTDAAPANEELTLEQEIALAEENDENDSGGRIVKREIGDEASEDIDQMIDGAEEELRDEGGNDEGLDSGPKDNENLENVEDLETAEQPNEEIDIGENAMDTEDIVKVEELIAEMESSLVNEEDLVTIPEMDNEEKVLEETDELQGVEIELDAETNEEQVEIDSHNQPDEEANLEVEENPSTDIEVIEAVETEELNNQEIPLPEEDPADLKEEQEAENLEEQENSDPVVEAEIEENNSEHVTEKPQPETEIVLTDEPDPESIIDIQVDEVQPTETEETEGELPNPEEPTGNGDETLPTIESTGNVEDTPLESEKDAPEETPETPAELEANELEANEDVEIPNESVSEETMDHEIPFNEGESAQILIIDAADNDINDQIVIEEENHQENELPAYDEIVENLDTVEISNEDVQPMENEETPKEDIAVEEENHADDELHVEENFDLITKPGDGNETEILNDDEEEIWRKLQKDIELEEEEQKTLAAIRIQSSFRGYKTRKELCRQSTVGTGVVDGEADESVAANANEEEEGENPACDGQEDEQEVQESSNEEPTVEENINDSENLVDADVPETDDAPEAPQETDDAPEAPQEADDAPEAPQEVDGAPEAQQEVDDSPEASPEADDVPEASPEADDAPDASPDSDGLATADVDNVDATENEPIAEESSLLQELPADLSNEINDVKEEPLSNGEEINDIQLVNTYVISTEQVNDETEEPALVEENDSSQIDQNGESEKPSDGAATEMESEETKEETAEASEPSDDNITTENIVESTETEMETEETEKPTDDLAEGEPTEPQEDKPVTDTIEESPNEEIEDTKESTTQNKNDQELVFELHVQSNETTNDGLLESCWQPQLLDLNPTKTERISGDENQQCFESIDMGPAEAAAATKIQAGYRGYRDRKQLKAKNSTHSILSESKNQYSDELDEAYLLLQEQTAAATKIQANFKGYQDRKRVKRLKENRITQKQLDSSLQSRSSTCSALEGKSMNSADHSFENTDRENYAATKIQASFRGHKDRKLVKNMKNQNVQPQSCAQESEKTEKPSENLNFGANFELDEEAVGAATKIQAGFRGSRDRKRVKNLKDSKARQENAIIIENQASKQNEMEEMDHAATKIQASFRGHRDRKRMKNLKAQSIKDTNDEMTAAAIKIQAGFRGYKDRKRTRKIHQDRKQSKDVLHHTDQIERSPENYEEDCFSQDRDCDSRASVFRSESLPETQQTRTDFELNKRRSDSSPILYYDCAQMRRQMFAGKNDLEQEMAATKIQKNFRGYLVRSKARKH